MPKYRVLGVNWAHIWVRQILSSGESQNRSCRMQHHQVKSYDQISFLPGKWDPVQREGDIFGENAFFGISFYWPQDQESTLCYMNFRILTLMKWSNGHVGPVGFRRLPLTRWQVGGGAIPHKHGPGLASQMWFGTVWHCVACVAWQYLARCVTELNSVSHSLCSTV